MPPPIYGLLLLQRRMQHGTKATPAVNIVPLEAPIASTKEIEVSADPLDQLLLVDPKTPRPRQVPEADPPCCLAGFL